MKVQNPNAHLFDIVRKQNPKKFDYHKIKQTNTSRQPVLFEYITDIHLTRSEYIITSFIDFGQYYQGFSELENHASNLLQEISKLADTRLPYFMRSNDDSERALLDVIATHKKEAASMISMLEAHKLHFSKIIDHVTLATEDPVPKHRRSKRGIILGFINWLFGGNDNSETIKQIKENLNILEQNQETLGSELKRQLEMISNNNLEISKNRGLLNSLNKDFVKLNHSLGQVILELRALEFSRNFIFAILQIRNRLALLRDGLDNLRVDLTKIQEYMTSLTSHRVTPNLIPPTNLREILEDVVKKLESNPKLTLPVSQDTSIWSYYQFLKIDAFVHKDILIVLLIIPLIDTDLQFDVYKAHSLPLLHPDLKKVFTYEIENPYLAIRADGNYLTLPLHDDILSCSISAGHFCNLNTPLYPIKNTRQCTYHLLTNQEKEIERDCKINIQEYSHDQAINLDQNIWALSILDIPTELHVTCLTYSYEIKITANFQLVELENSCQAYNPNLILPSSNIIKSQKNGSLIEQRFFNFDLEETSIPNFWLMNTFNLTKLTPEQVGQIAQDLPPLNKIDILDINKLLEPIDTDYPFEMPTYAYVLISAAVTTLLILIIGVLYYVRYRRARAAATPAVKYSKRKPPSKEEIELQPLSLTTTNKQVEEPSTSGRKTPITPLLIRKKLEEDFNIDFSTYERKKKQRETGISSLV